MLHGEPRDSVTRTVARRFIAVIGIALKPNGELHRASIHTG